MRLQQLYNKIKHYWHRFKLMFTIFRQPRQSELDDPMWMNGFAIGFKHGKEMGYKRGFDNGYQRARKEIEERMKEQDNLEQPTPQSIREWASVPYAVSDEELWERERGEGVEVLM